MFNKKLLKNIYKLEETWLKHIGCKIVENRDGIIVSNPYNPSEDFNYFLPKKIPKLINHNIVKIRQSDDRNGILSQSLIDLNFQKVNCDDIQLIYLPSSNQYKELYLSVIDGLKIEESNPKDWIENNSYDLNRDFSVGMFLPLILLRGRRRIGRVNLLKANGFIGIFDLLITKEFRGMGIGQWFVYNVMKKVPGNVYFIQTWATNTAALKVYTSLGFKEIDHYHYFIK